MEQATSRVSGPGFLVTAFLASSIKKQRGRLGGLMSPYPEGAGLSRSLGTFPS